MTEPWTRLSVRRGNATADGPFEGLPEHLHYSVGQWLRGQFGWFDTTGMRDRLMREVASALRITIRPSSSPGGISDQIFFFIESDPDLYLDCLDVTLYLNKGSNSAALDNALRIGGSVWGVGDSRTMLERRVDEASKSSFDQSVAAGDASAEELREAWAALYGRNPDPSDAWDHAIKAVEELLIPIVLAKANKPNLGGVAGELKANPGLWTFNLPANDTRSNGETLEGLIRHIWPNPDRHGGSSKRAPTLEEAEAVVQIAVLIVNLCRNRLVKASSPPAP